MEARMEKLRINPNAKSKATPSSKSKAPIVDSWDEDDASSSNDDGSGIRTTSKRSSIPNAPPPTPSSPQGNFPNWNAMDTEIYGRRSSPGGTISRAQDEDKRRPEKSTAVAGRLIAAGIGAKAPKRTEEQRAYDRATKEKEIRRRNREKEDGAARREENEKAKVAVWDG